MGAVDRKSQSSVSGSPSFGKKRTKARHYDEAKVLDALKVREAHPEEMITLESLQEALEASESNLPTLQMIIEAARENSELEAQVQEIGLIDSIRIIGRIDSNVRELLGPSSVGRSRPGTVDPDFGGGRSMPVEARFRRIEDAVAGLSHKLTSMLPPPLPAPSTMQTLR